MLPANDDDIKVDKLILERVHIYLSMVSSTPMYLQEPQVRVQELANLADQMAYTLSGWLIGNKFPERSEFETIEYPDGPWEMLKERYAPAWVLEKWPIKMKVVRYENARYRYNICPHWNENYSGIGGKHIHYAFMAKRPDWARKEGR